MDEDELHLNKQMLAPDLQPIHLTRLKPHSSPARPFPEATITNPTLPPTNRSTKQLTEVPRAICNISELTVGQTH